MFSKTTESELSWRDKLNARLSHLSTTTTIGIKNSSKVTSRNGASCKKPTDLGSNLIYYLALPSSTINGQLSRSSSVRSNSSKKFSGTSNSSSSSSNVSSSIGKTFANKSRSHKRVGNSRQNYHGHSKATTTPMASELVNKLGQKLTGWLKS